MAVDRVLFPQVDAALYNASHDCSDTPRAAAVLDRSHTAVDLERSCIYSSFEGVPTTRRSSSIPATTTFPLRNCSTLRRSSRYLIRHLVLCRYSGMAKNIPQTHKLRFAS